jgi:hypothetical protein
MHAHLPRHKVCCKAGGNLPQVVTPQILGAALDGNLKRLPHTHALHVACSSQEEEQVDGWMDGWVA